MPGIGTTFEQYKDVDVSLGINASHDDLRTDESASSSLQNKRDHTVKCLVIMDLLLIKEIELMPTRSV